MEKGDLVSDFELLDANGTRRHLSHFLARGPVILFFYPRALSSGCTAESCHFRDLAAEFAEVGAQPVGISTDPVGRQRQFSERHSLGMPLLSDPDGSVAREFGVRRRFGPSPVKRWTFVIDTERRVQEVIKSETRMAAHADRALAFLQPAS